MSKLFKQVDKNTFKTAQQLNEEQMIALGPNAILEAVADKTVDVEEGKELLKKYFKSPDHEKDTEITAKSGCVY